MQIIEWAPIIISFIAVLLAFWQGYIAKKQLAQAKITKTETENILSEIKVKVEKIEMISNDTKENIKNQVSKLIDKQDENLKVLLSSSKENSQNEMVMKLLPSLLEKPDILQKIIEAVSK